MIGLVLLIWGGDRFVTGAAALARNLGVSPMLIGLTIVALGTSAPEVCVSIVASIKGDGSIAVGNALGSTIANIGLVLGVITLIKPLKIQSNTLNLEFPLMFIVMLVAALLFSDGDLTYLDGFILLLGFAAYILILTRVGLRTQQAVDRFAIEESIDIPKQMPMLLTLIWIVVGAILLPLGSEILVTGAVGVARLLGVSNLLIGLTIVAIGTSLPELVASLFGVIKGEDGIALGNIIGSNIFNLLAVLAIPGLIHPAYFGLIVMQRDFIFILLLTLYLYYLVRSKVDKKEAVISRWNGAIFLIIYIIYFILVIYWR